MPPPLLKLNISIEVLLWNLSFDGSNFVRCVDTHVIYPWEGERDPRFLGIYPTDLHHESPAVGHLSMREKLIERGKKYAKLAYRSHCDYHGQCLVHPKRTVSHHSVTPCKVLILLFSITQPWWLIRRCSHGMTPSSPDGNPFQTPIRSTYEYITQVVPAFRANSKSLRPFKTHLCLQAVIILALMLNSRMNSI